MVFINKTLREADPDSCARIDDLRLHRKPLAERLCYLQSTGNHHATAASEAAQIAQKLIQLNREINVCYANAKATAAEAKSKQLRAASAAITVAKKGADKVLSDMMKEAQRHNNKMMALVARQAEHLEGVDEIANVMEAAAVAEEARIGPAADDEQICADGDDQTIAIADSDAQPCIAVVKGAAESLADGGETQKAKPEAAVECAGTRQTRLAQRARKSAEASRGWQRTSADARCRSMWTSCKAHTHQPRTTQLQPARSKRQTR